jgi:cobalt-zinc-cadmium efflux system protein
MRRFPEVTDVHHIHVWLHGDGMSACTCHIVVRPDVTHERDHELVAKVRDMLREDFDIAHPTIESEHESCETAKACDWNRHP